MGDEKPFDFIFASPVESSTNLALGFLTNNSREPLNVLVTDAYGKKIYSSSISPIEGFNKKEIQLPELASAVYFVMLANSTGTVTKKFFKN